MPITSLGNKSLISSLTSPAFQLVYQVDGESREVKTTIFSWSCSTSHNPGRSLKSGQKYSPSASKINTPTFFPSSFPLSVLGTPFRYNSDTRNLIKFDLPYPARAKTTDLLETRLLILNFTFSSGVMCLKSDSGSLLFPE